MTAGTTENAEASVDRPVKIRVTDVERTFVTRKRRVDALGPVTMEIAQGEFVCVVGPSGCGKSTLLRIVAGLLNPTAGGIDLYPRSADEVATAMVFQDYGIYPWKTVRQNVRFGLDVGKLQRMKRSERNARVDELLERFGLIEFANAFPGTLSGGMKQRVSIARALAPAPEILLMDEPFAALDAQMRLVLQEELLRLWEEDRRTVMFITHSLEEAILLGDRVVIMSARPGKIISDHRVEFPRPRTPEIRGLPEFAELHEQIWELLRREVQVASRAPSVSDDPDRESEAASGSDR